MALPPTRAVRDANLDALLAAVTKWSQIEMVRLDNETKFLQAVLKDRGASATASKNLAAASSLINSGVNEFVLFWKNK